jgi:cbb3-type cytochrome oxidase subunit 3
MNNVIKTFAKVLSQFERAHSYSEMEKAVSSKLVVTLVTNMVILPLLLSAKVGVLKWVPFLFEGDHRDFNRTWYEDFCNRFSQVAMVNSIMFPATSILPAVVWRVKRAVLGRYSKTQQQLNDVYKPPAYQLSERSAVYTAAIVYSLMFSSGIPLVYVYLIFMSLGFMVADRLMLLRYSQIPPRYTGKICALVLHAVPVAVLLHFLIAVYVFGERDLPSYTMDGTESGKWRHGHHGTKYVEDKQTDIGARLNRYNGFVPFMGFIIVSVMTIVLYSVLWILHRRKKRSGHDDETMEGCPPVREAIAAGSVCGLKSYSITAHPDFLQVFPKDAPFSKGL